MQVWELKKLRDSSSSGVISLDDPTFDKYVQGSDRPYSLFIFFNAKLKESANLRMGELFSNFKLAAEHIRKVSSENEHAAAANKVFFVEMEFENSRNSFGRMGVQQIPWMIYLRGDATSGCARPLQLTRACSCMGLSV